MTEICRERETVIERQKVHVRKREREVEIIIKKVGVGTDLSLIW